MSEQVQETKHAALGDGQLHAYVGKVDLPADGVWKIRSPKNEVSVRELYLVPTQPARLRQLGNRMYAALEEREVQASRWQVQRGYEASREFAQEKNGVGPKAFSDFEGDRRWSYLVESWDSLSYRRSDITELLGEQSPKGPFVHLIPGVSFDFEPLTAGSPTTPLGAKVRRNVKKENRKLLAFQLRPFVEDGQHWVLYTDGECERIEIDPVLLEEQQVEIRPIITKDQWKAVDQPTIPYQVVLVSDQSLDDTLLLEVDNQVLDREAVIRWGISKPTEAGTEVIHETVNRVRRSAWQPYLMAGGRGVLQIWDQIGKSSQTNNGTRGNAAARNLSMFSILGGRAAIEETLQLQNLVLAEEDQTESVDVDSLKGVEVESHPFEEMLDGQVGGQLELSRYVPADRFFLYVGQPESIPALLDKGAPFIASMGTSLTGNCLNYNLEARYLSRLGMTRDWVDAVLASGLTSEMAVFTPDLFFIDGTDMTIVARLRSPELLRRMLGLLGAADLTTESVLELPTGSGEQAYLALRGDLLFASTHRGELEQSIDLFNQEGRGSLGDSAEFRYMLTKMAVTDETRLYAYLSDPFVRRLVGPRVKIGQRRRVIAKAKMEALTAHVLMSRLDGQDSGESFDELMESGYVPKRWDLGGMSVDSNGLVSSQHYGSLPRMRSLPDLPLKNVTPAEAEAYRLYVENYSRYWRRFYDPIAVRLDEVGSDQLELSTFILPLVDNSIYNGLREVLAHQDDQTTLSVPIVDPAPVLQFSMNLSEKAWEQYAGGFSEFFSRYSGVSSAILDDFGPSAHVAIFDADPIVAWGSGDIFGAFGGQAMRGDGDEMLMLPVALSMFTRPCSIMVETKSPLRTKQYLRQAAIAGGASNRTGGFLDTAVSFYQVGDQDSWVWTLDIVGMVKLRYGVEVVGKYLVIRNIPWSTGDRVVSVSPAELNGAELQANPSACEQQLPALFAAAADGNRRAAMSGLGRLYPFMLAGAESVSEAVNQHQRLYGFYPKPLGNDQWRWADFQMQSDDYGRPTNQRQPGYDPNEPFGLMNQIDSIRLNMQFEEDGLRSSVRWRLR
ncbi:MAG: hypothetical protein P8L85_17490 [Rubripirellula sp.]|nr:hypothetical protein [Rubripirellula sp.]